MKPAPAPRPPSPSRRAFVQGGAVSARTAARDARVPSANDRDGVGFIGSGLIGKRHVLDFRAEPDVAAVAVAEVHRGRPDEATAPIGGTVKGTGRVLRWLDDRDVDAVVGSMLDHWHALVTMMACVAGQDVDVGERPSRGDRLSPGQPVATARPRIRWDPAQRWSSTVRKPRGCANVPIVHPGMGSSRDWEWAELMTPSRREFLAACAGAIPALAGESSRGGEGNADDQPSLGVVIHTYSGRVAADRARGGSNRLDDPLNFLEYCHAMGIRGVQVAIGARDSAYSERLAKRAAANGMYLEGIVRLPGNRIDMERFRDEVGTAFLAGGACSGPR